jgi:hypothetical protein
VALYQHQRAEGVAIARFLGHRAQRLAQRGPYGSRADSGGHLQQSGIAGRRNCRPPPSREDQPRPAKRRGSSFRIRRLVVVARLAVCRMRMLQVGCCGLGYRFIAAPLSPWRSVSSAARSGLGRRLLQRNFLLFAVCLRPERRLWAQVRGRFLPGGGRATTRCTGAKAV